MASQMILQAKALFFDAAIAGGFRELAEAAYKALKFPLLLFDKDNHILFQTPAHKIQNFVFDSFLDSKKATPDMCILHQSILSTPVSGKANPGTYVYRYLDSPTVGESAFACLIYSVRTSAETLAFLHLYPPSNSLSSEEREILSLLGSVIAKKLQDKTAKFLPTQQKLFDFLALLRDTSGSMSTKEFFVKLRKDIPGPYQLLVSISAREDQSETSTFFEQQVMKVSPGTLAVRHNNHVVILCNKLGKLPADSGSFSPQVNAVIEFSRKCSVPLSLSFPFQSLEELQVHYQQAYLGARLSRRLHMKEMVLPPEKYMAHIPFLSAIEKTDPNAFLHPLILQILDWDHRYNTEYLKTLREYLLSGRKKKTTAQRLSIHQNTLLYRLARIDDIFCIDYEDIQLTTILLLNLLLLEVTYPALYGSN